MLLFVFSAKGLTNTLVLVVGALVAVITIHEFAQLVLRSRGEPWYTRRGSLVFLPVALLCITARKQTEGNDAERAHIPEPTCGDLDEWDLQMQELSGGVLWDGDYQDAQLYIDFPPEKSKELRGMMGIPDDYYMALADDLTDDEAKAQIMDLRKLCDSTVEPS